MKELSEQTKEASFFSKYKVGDPRRVLDHQIAFQVINLNIIYKRNNQVPVWLRKGIQDKMVFRGISSLLFAVTAFTVGSVISAVKV